MARILLLTLLVVYVIYSCKRTVQQNNYKEDQKIAIAPPPNLLITFSFAKPFDVQLADKGKNHRATLRLNLAYKGENKNLEKELLSRSLQMQHIINLILATKKRSDLSSTLQKLNLAEEIKSQINMILSNGQIEEIFFIELEVK